jgi:hypothetical protein
MLRRDLQQTALHATALFTLVLDRQKLVVWHFRCSAHVDTCGPHCSLDESCVVPQEWLLERRRALEAAHLRILR